MPKVNIDVPSPFSAQETFDKVKDLLENDDGLKKIDSDIKATFNPEQRSGDLTGSKFKAHMAVADNGDKSSVSIVVDLPMLLGAFKGQVKSTIEKKLGKILS